jgi:CubicO group peptidase (beta-lactamase class C family)
MDTTQLKAVAAKVGLALTDAELVEVLPKVARAMERRPAHEDWSAADVLERAGALGPFAEGHTGDVPATVGGYVKPGFEAVKQAFAANYSKGLERNSQCAAYFKGELVVDLYGSSDLPGMSTAPPSGYDADTLQIVFSSTKAVASVCMAVAVDRGYCSYDDTVASHWPDFAQAGKCSITIADCLRHDCGLQTVAVKLTMEDIDRQNDPNGALSKAFAAQKPWAWKDGANAGHTPRLYHAVTRGWVLSQILMRVDPAKRTVGQFLQDEVAGPLGADFFCGPSNDLSAADYRVKENWTDAPTAKMLEIPPAWTFGNQTVPGIIRSTLRQRFPPGAGAGRARELVSGQPQQDPEQAGFPPAPYGSGAPREWREDDGAVTSLAVNKSPLSLNQTPRTRQMDTPSSSGHATARGMAKIMGAMGNGGELNGVRIISAEGVARAIQHPVHAMPRAPPPHGAGLVLPQECS